ncbi:hypothetical protein [Bosea sp. BK604]|uniref:hypothetical protein n=1 Tax=Bosea sp. BK604 TaxID=2512180 RepID=UPI0020C11B5F|nr:hypothetical protein [Bosea sp. BK604]
MPNYTLPEFNEASTECILEVVGAALARGDLQSKKPDAHSRYGAIVSFIAAVRSNRARFLNGITTSNVKLYGGELGESMLRVAAGGFNRGACNLEVCIQRVKDKINRLPGIRSRVIVNKKMYKSGAISYKNGDYAINVSSYSPFARGMPGVNINSATWIDEESAVHLFNVSAPRLLELNRAKIIDKAKTGGMNFYDRYQIGKLMLRIRYKTKIVEGINPRLLCSVNAGRVWYKMPFQERILAILNGHVVPCYVDEKARGVERILFKPSDVRNWCAKMRVQNSETRR